MSVGFTTDKSVIDTRSGSLAQTIFKWAEDATELNSWLLTQGEADLEALGYTADDVALLKSAANDMATLARVFRGEIEQTPAYDFRTFTGRIAGLQI